MVCFRGAVLQAAAQAASVIVTLDERALLDLPVWEPAY